MTALSAAVYYYLLNVLLPDDHLAQEDEREIVIRAVLMLEDNFPSEEVTVFELAIKNPRKKKASGPNDIHAEVL